MAGWRARPRPSGRARRRLSSVPFGDPFHLWRKSKAPFAQRPRHDIEVIHIKPIRRPAGMVTAWHTDNIAVAYRHGLIKAAVIGIDPLNAKAIGGVQSVVIGFFQIGDSGKIIFIVAVTGKAGPMAVGVNTSVTSNASQ